MVRVTRLQHYRHCYLAQTLAGSVSEIQPLKCGLKATTLFSTQFLLSYKVSTTWHSSAPGADCGVLEFTDGDGTCCTYMYKITYMYMFRALIFSNNIMRNFEIALRNL